MGERIYLIIQDMFFSEKNIRNILLILLFLFVPICILLKTNINICDLSCIINGDMFNVSGILAGFVFSGLGFIVVSDSEMINNLKRTGNYKIIKNFFIRAIQCFTSVVVLYLLKPLIITEEILKNIESIFWLKKYIIIIYLLGILFLFIFGCILFLFCLFILDKRISEN